MFGKTAILVAKMSFHGKNVLLHLHFASLHICVNVCVCAWKYALTSNCFWYSSRSHIHTNRYFSYKLKYRSVAKTSVAMFTTCAVAKRRLESLVVVFIPCGSAESTRYTFLGYVKLAVIIRPHIAFVNVIVYIQKIIPIYIHEISTLNRSLKLQHVKEERL